MAVVVRPAAAQEDWGAVSRIYEESWKFAYRGIVPDSYLDAIPAGRWVTAGAQPGRQHLVLADGPRLLGTCSVSPSRSELFPGYGELVSLYLLPCAMGKGFGRRLLAAGLALLARQGYREAFLWVLEENRRARAFYERAGLVQAGQRTSTRLGGATLWETAYRCGLPHGVKGERDGGKENV